MRPRLTPMEIKPQKNEGNKYVSSSPKQVDNKHTTSSPNYKQTENNHKQVLLTPNFSKPVLLSPKAVENNKRSLSPNPNKTNHTGSFVTLTPTFHKNIPWSAMSRLQPDYEDDLEEIEVYTEDAGKIEKAVIRSTPYQTKVFRSEPVQKPTQSTVTYKPQTPVFVSVKPVKKVEVRPSTPSIPEQKIPTHQTDDFDIVEYIQFSSPDEVKPEKEIIESDKPVCYFTSEPTPSVEPDAETLRNYTLVAPHDYGLIRVGDKVRWLNDLNQFHMGGRIVEIYRTKSGKGVTWSVAIKPGQNRAFKPARMLMVWICKSHQTPNFDLWQDMYDFLTTKYGREFTEFMAHRDTLRHQTVMEEI